MDKEDNVRTNIGKNLSNRMVKQMNELFYNLDDDSQGRLTTNIEFSDMIEPDIIEPDIKEYFIKELKEYGYLARLIAIEKMEVNGRNFTITFTYCKKGEVESYKIDNCGNKERLYGSISIKTFEELLEKYRFVNMKLNDILDNYEIIKKDNK